MAQHVVLDVPRVQSKDGKEIVLKNYQDFQDPKLFEQAVFAEGIKKVSQRDYEKGVQKIASSFDFRKSSVSRKWVKATAKKIVHRHSTPSGDGQVFEIFRSVRHFSSQEIFG